MKLNGLAKRVGKSVPYVMTLQKKFGLPVCKDYPDGYVVLVKKLIYLSIGSVSDKEIKSLLSKERKLLELFTQVCAVRLHPCGGAVTVGNGNSIPCMMVNSGLTRSEAFRRKATTEGRGSACAP